LIEARRGPALDDGGTGIQGWGQDWAALRAVETQLRADEVFWPGVWAPASSYAAWKLGEADARVLLEEAIASGLDGLGGLEAELTEAFGADPDWPELVEAMRAEVLLRDRAEAYPNLSELTVGIGNVDGSPAIRPDTEHLYAAGFAITTSDAAPVRIALDEAWPVPRWPAGVHSAEIATVTPFGVLTPSTLTFRVRER
jgi:hypothetical protein